MPTLNWLGKDKVINHHQDVPFRVLDCKYAFGASSNNMLINGDHLENTESERKCRICREWANLAGADFRYYMVFRDKDLKWDGAVRFNRLIEIVQGL